MAEDARKVFGICGVNAVEGDHALLTFDGILGGGGCSVQKTLWGCAANIGSKISLLLYELRLIKFKISCRNELIFQNFNQFEQAISAQISEKKLKNRVILIKIW